MGTKIGDVSITPIIEIDYPVPASFLLPDATPENLAPDLDWLEPHFVTPRGERLKMIIQAFLVESRGLKIVVDTCVGNDKKRALPAWNELDGPFLQEIRDAGFPREQVDLVVCTHLHIDHVGWNTMKVDGQWVPTFPNARYIMARPEFDYWKDAGEGNWGDVFGDSVAPVFEAGLVDLVDCDHQINPELQFFPTPGHTPGLWVADITYATIVLDVQHRHREPLLRQRGGRDLGRRDAPPVSMRPPRVVFDRRHRPRGGDRRPPQLLRALQRYRHHRRRHPLGDADRGAAHRARRRVEDPGRLSRLAGPLRYTPPPS